jgi:hypothetical protein
MVRDLSRADKTKEEAQGEMGGPRFCAKRVACRLVVGAVLIAAGVGAWSSIPGAGAASAPDFSLIAGGSTTTPTTGGTPALAIELNHPQDVATDANGNVVICDTSNDEIEVLAESTANPGYTIGSGARWTVGSVYVIAGNGTLSPVPVTTGSPGASTGLDAPQGVAVDRSGNVLIADTYNNEVEVLAVSATNPGYVLGTDALWIAGDLYVIAGIGRGTTSPVPTTSGAPATTDGFNLPAGVGVDGAGNVLIADTGHNLVEALAVGSSRPGYLAASSLSWTHGDLYVVAGGGGDQPSTNGTTGVLTTLDQPSGVVADGSGNVIISDKDDDEIEVLAGSATDPSYPLGDSADWTDRDLYVIAGGGSTTPSPLGSPADETALASPIGVVTDAVGNVVVADAADHEIEVLAVSSADPGYLLASGATWSPGDLYVVAGGGKETPSASGTDGLSTQLSQTDGVAVAPSGGVVVADSGDSEIDFLNRAPVPPVLVAAAPGDGSVALGWSAPATDGGSAVTGYDVLVFAGGSSTPQETLLVGAGTTSCVVEGLTDGVSYSFEVDAFTVIGTSQPSSALAATPEAGSGGSGSGGSGSGGSGSGGSGAGGSGSSSPQGAGSARPRIVLTKRIAPVKSGFATLSLRCNTQLCGGELQLTARRVVRLKSHGRTHKEVETVLVSSDHFSIRGGAVVSLPVPVTAHAIHEITAVRRYRVTVTATFVVTKGLKSTYKLRLVAA